MTAIDEDLLRKRLDDELPSQRWFGARRVASLDAMHVLRDETPTLVQAIVRGDDGSRYQAVLGVDHDDVFDATGDADLALALFRLVLPDADVSKSRPLGAEQSNTSLVFDERYVFKLFRRLQDGPNPDTEVTRALAATGFPHVIAPIAEWREDGTDYAVVTELLVDATDGWHAALTSLRDLYDRRCAPEEAAGDFGFEAERLGRATAELHVSLAEDFGTERADAERWVADMEAQLRRIGLPGIDPERVRAAYRAVLDVDPGPAFRIHGDYHLGQTLRTDTGWYIIDFEGEPARPLEERRGASSPLRDVAGMVRSLQYAAEVALREFAGDDAEALRDLAAAWERHNTERFLAGYEGYGDADRVLPPPEARSVVRRAFELDKAVYEVGYEAGHRPDWIGIPLAAVKRALEAG